MIIDDLAFDVDDKAQEEEKASKKKIKKVVQTETGLQ